MSSRTRSALPVPDDTHVAGFLAALCRYPDLHARFLNTLSLMEHVGSRKIMASQTGPELRQDTLKHLAEETRHAFFFRRTADTLAGRVALDYRRENTVAPAAARFYMGRLDAFIARALGKTMPGEAAYLYMSLIVELRAVWFYRIYEQVLKDNAEGISLSGILSEEERHLGEMTARLRAIDNAFQTRMRQFSACESERFGSLWAAVERDCAPRMRGIV